MKTKLTPRVSIPDVSMRATRHAVQMEVGEKLRRDAHELDARDLRNLAARLEEVGA